MARPTVTCRIAFVNNPADTALTWVDVSAYVLEFHVNLGRDDETKQFDTGTAQVILDNRDRRFDPSNTSSPYAPNVLPMKRMNLRATWSSITYDLFTGFIEDFPLPSADLQLTCELSANDPFETLNNATVSGEARAVERSDQRIARLLTLAGLPTAAYSLAAGKTSVGAEVGETTTFTDAAGNDVAFVSYGNWGVLEKIREAETAERGQLYADGTGVIVFRDRHYRLLSQATNNATFGDGAGELPLLTLTTSTGVDLIFNEARATRKNAGATVYVQSDAASKTQYLTRSWPSGGAVEETTATPGAEAEALAQYIVDRYKQPIPRIASITVGGEADAAGAVWVQALARTIGDKVTVNNRYLGKGSVFTQVSRIERVQHEFVQDGAWLTTWALSPTSPYEAIGYWKLEDAASQLGTNTYLAF